MIVGLGTDVCSIPRMRKAIARHGEAFAKRICTAREIEARVARGGDVAEWLAARFAAKEALAKALDGAPGASFHDAEIMRGTRGAPELVLLGRCIELARDKGATRAHVSLTHDADVAFAVVILESTDLVPSPNGTRG